MDRRWPTPRSTATSLCRRLLHAKLCPIGNLLNKNFSLYNLECRFFQSVVYYRKIILTLQVTSNCSCGADTEPGQVATIFTSCGIQVIIGKSSYGSRRFVIFLPISDYKHSQIKYLDLSYANFITIWTMIPAKMLKPCLAYRAFSLPDPLCLADFTISLRESTQCWQITSGSGITSSAVVQTKLAFPM